MTRPTRETDMAGRPAALITGGSKRVGRAVAIGLAEAGYDVAVTYLTSRADADSLVEQVRAIGRKAIAIKADQADPASPDVIVGALRNQFGRLDALINNASIFGRSSKNNDPTELDRYFAVNARGPLLLTQACVPLLAANKPAEGSTVTGRVVNMLDVHVMHQPAKGYLAYNASKASLLEITRSLALELAPRITVNGIAPGVVEWAESYTPEQREQYLRRVPLGRAGTPHDVARAVLYFVRDADYCTGEILRLDGGRSLT
ncbi:MAG: SDR family oxidoreductase [Phycisphaeraceae bacterium]|nr:SDR family oxidoreductase [Phycisphaeraceae bacterium]